MNLYADVIFHIASFTVDPYQLSKENRDCINSLLLVRKEWKKLTEEWAPCFKIARLVIFPKLFAKNSETVILRKGYELGKLIYNLSRFFFIFNKVYPQKSNIIEIARNAFHEDVKKNKNVPLNQIDVRKEWIFKELPKEILDTDRPDHQQIETIFTSLLCATVWNPSSLKEQILKYNEKGCPNSSWKKAIEIFNSCEMIQTCYKSPTQFPVKLEDKVQILEQVAPYFVCCNFSDEAMIKSYFERLLENLSNVSDELEQKLVANLQYFSNPTIVIPEVILRKHTNNKDMAISLLKNKRQYINFFSPTIKEDAADVLKKYYIEKCAHIDIETDLPEEFTKDDVYMRQIIKICPKYYSQASEKVQEDPDLVFEILGYHGALIGSVAKKFQNDSRYVLRALGAIDRTGSILYASERCRNEKEIVELAIQNNPREILLASENMRKCPEIVLLAVQKDLSLYGTISSDQLEGRDLLLQALKNIHDSSLYEKLFPHVKRNRDITLEACRAFGGTLKFVPIDLLDDEEIVQAAIDSGYQLSQYYEILGPEFKPNKGLYGIHESKKISPLQYASERLQTKLKKKKSCIIS